MFRRSGWQLTMMMRCLLLGLLGAAAATYNETLALRDLYVSQATMCDAKTLENWTCGDACANVSLASPRVVVNASSDALALVARTADGCLLAFRGSATPLNYLEDATFFPASPYPACEGCAVHSGFHDTWRSVAPAVAAEIADLGCARLEILGHSLGGAMAALAAYELAATIDVARVYTYGQPRVGNAAWAAAFAALELDYARVVLYKDAVPHLPMDDMFWEGWTHAMPEIYYNATAPGAYRACDDAADARCSYGWNLVETLLHTCDHCSYLGMNPCECATRPPNCAEPR